MMLSTFTDKVEIIGFMVFPVDRSDALKVSERAWKKDNAPVISRYLTPSGNRFSRKPKAVSSGSAHIHNAKLTTIPKRVLTITAIPTICMNRVR